MAEMYRHSHPIRIFIGTTGTQKLAFQVLEYSIRRHTTSRVEITNLDDILPDAYRNANRTSRTGFSFSRLAIPELCSWAGNALYLDADMLVFDDIAELWSIPFPDNVSLLYSQQPKGRSAYSQYAVLALNCQRLRFDINAIVSNLEQNEKSYADILFEFDSVPESEKQASVPMAWNSLEYFSKGTTKLLHYTNMPFQPWVYPHNPNGALWYQAMRDAINDGAISVADVAREIDRGNVSPALPRKLAMDIPAKTRSSFGWIPPVNRRSCRDAGFGGRALRRIVRDTIVLSSWFQGTLGTLAPARYNVYDSIPPSLPPELPRNP